MMRRPRITFLIPAHNEESIISTALNNLLPLAGPKVEILVGLDGCTDRTKHVVQQFRIAQCIELDIRQGKQAVVNALLDIAQGDIAIIHDADWHFVCDRLKLDYLITCFDDLGLGGIVLPPHNIPFWDLKKGITSSSYLGAGLGNLLLSEYRLLTQAKMMNGQLYVDPDKIIYPFTLDIFRREAVADLTTVADDFERFMILLDAGYKIRIFNDPSLPYFEISEKTSSFGDQYRQRVRGHIARAQLKNRFPWQANVFNFYMPFLWYCLKKTKKVGWNDFWKVMVWFGILVLSMFQARIILRRGVPDARETWRWNRSSGYKNKTKKYNKKELDST